MSKIEGLRERLTVASADGKISDDVLSAVANMLESRWPGQFACNAMSEPALLAALLEDAGAVKVRMVNGRTELLGGRSATHWLLRIREEGGE